MSDVESATVPDNTTPEMVNINFFIALYELLIVVDW